MTIKFRPSQKRAAEYLLCGLSYAEIADELDICESTVKKLFKEMLDIAGMDDRVGLALWLHEHREELKIDCPCNHGYSDGALLVMSA